MTAQDPHIVLFSHPGKGHINPFMFLARELARRGVLVSLVVPGDVAVAEIQTKVGDQNIKLVALPNLFPPNGKKTRITMEGIRRPLLRFNTPPSIEEPFKKLLKGMLASSSPPVAVVVDLLLRSSSSVVDELNIPRYVLYTAATSHLAVALHFKELQKDKEEKLEDQDIVQVPGLPPVSWHEIPGDIMNPTIPFFVPIEVLHRFYLDSKGLLLNTSYAIEEKVIDALRGSYPRTNFIPVGPLGLDEPSPLGSELESQCKEWLDTQAERSVVFVSFGSWAGLSRLQILELAKGLDSSNFSFLWLLPVSEEEGGLDAVLPEGFLSRTKERGLVLEEWAPQKLILSHSSLGAFVTHCGWNSVTECIGIAGVPMVGWPFVADQPVICRYLVEALGVAVGIVEDESGTALAAEVERALRQVMTDPDVRQRASKLKQRVRDEAANEQNNLENLVHCLKQSCA